jgi:hypothetical protein
VTAIATAGWVFVLLLAFALVTQPDAVLFERGHALSAVATVTAQAAMMTALSTYVPTPTRVSCTPSMYYSC